MLKIFIAVSTFNRKNITKLCLENLQKIIDDDNFSFLSIYDDASDKYDLQFLKKFSKNVLRFRTSGGIERSRARTFRDFEYIFSTYDLLYITDNDTIHDPNFLKTIREMYTLSAANFEKPLPIGLFNSVFHSQEANIINSDGLVSVRKTCPGVSQCYDRKMVSKIVDFLNKNPVYETLYGFDYHWPASLSLPFLQSNISYLEHFARDRFEKGIHSDFSNDDPLKDFERDRAQNPTDYLKKIRMDIINNILYK